MDAKLRRLLYDRLIIICRNCRIRRIKVIHEPLSDIRDPFSEASSGADTGVGKPDAGRNVSCRKATAASNIAVGSVGCGAASDIEFCPDKVACILNADLSLVLVQMIVQVSFL